MERCRACHGSNLTCFLRLGMHPPANAFVHPEHAGRAEFTAPLDAYACLDCALIQVADQVPAEFFRHYLYTPAASDGLRRHFESLADHLAAQTQGLVVDVGCNVGLLLDACRDRGLPVLGIDPADNLTELPRSKGHAVMGAYFDADVARRARDAHGPAAVVVTTNTFNHIDDLHGFASAARTLLADDGLFVVEVPHAADLLEQNQFDTLYHEHLSEFSVRSFDALLRATALELIDVAPVAVHGGSMRITAQRAGGPRSVGASVARWLGAEVDRGLFDPGTYTAFAERVAHNRERLIAMLQSLRAGGARVAAYGAPAKGNTLLIHAGIGPETLDYVVDRSPLKQGLLTPCTHVPIVGPERLVSEPPDYLLLLAWNHADEIFAQLDAFTARGGRFIVPIPEPRIVP